jgi:hypothetical protein
MSDVKEEDIDFVVKLIQPNIPHQLFVYKTTDVLIDL